VNVGIIGTGRVATYAQAPGYVAAGANLMAVADSVPGRAEAFAAERGIPHAFSSYHEMLALSELEGVSICVPPIAHEEVALAAFEAGKHVYLEKPPAMNAAEMERIVAAGRRAGKLLMTGSHTVYWRETQVLRRMIEAGELGEIYVVKNRGGRRRGTPRGWFRELAKSGGGVGMDGSSHALDRLLYLLGTPQPVSVTARTYDHFRGYIPVGRYISIGIEQGTETDVPEADVEDTVIALIQFDTGCTAFIEDTWVVNAPRGGSLQLYGTQAGASLSPLKLYSELERGVLTDTEPSFIQGPRTHEEALRHFAQCIQDGVETESPGERGIIVMRIIDAIYESAANGGAQVRLS
jgi:predicted dehydrogenase